MGASFFTTISHGNTIGEAFDEAVRRAQYDHGHSGYTGTIAEKPGYYEFTFESLDRALEVHRLYNEWSDEMTEAERRDAVGAELWDRITEVCEQKWDPCAAIKIDDNTWVFFGYASC